MHPLQQNHKESSPPSLKKGLALLQERQKEIEAAFDTFNVQGREALVLDSFRIAKIKGAGVGYHELKASLRALDLPAKLLEGIEPKADVLAAMRAHGLSDDSVLDFTSFSRILWSKFNEQDPLPTMLKTFRLFDKEGSGRIGLRDLRRASKEAELPLKEEELERMIAYFDQNSSGTIGEAEFVQVMLAADLQ
ncbi:unnamed protein product [Symbiodinium natans]|uniref:EF-hand domain-containing protein n=1 Tax=Symbiodinium natans TaxID=878477 RepID=A0A812RTW1_9DINO|nr:unnamed protein product [Symbiodinium natans]